MNKPSDIPAARLQGNGDEEPTSILRNISMILCSRTFFSCNEVRQQDKNLGVVSAKNVGTKHARKFKIIFKI